MSLAFPDLPPTTLDADGRIEADLPCPRCGYSLRHQAAGGACPECGLVIAGVVAPEALEPEAESAAHAAWRRRVESAPKALSTGLALVPLGVYPGLLVLAWGVWRMTGREPGRRESRSQKVTRWVARWGTALGAPGCVAAVAYAAWMLMQRRGLGGDGWGLVDAGVAAPHVTLGVSLMFAWRHLHDLAARAQRPDASLGLRKLWRRYFNGLLVLTVLAVGFVALELGMRGQRVYLQVSSAAAALSAAVACAVLMWLYVSTLKTLRGLALTPGGRGVGEGADHEDRD